MSSSGSAFFLEDLPHHGQVAAGALEGTGDHAPLAGLKVPEERLDLIVVHDRKRGFFEPGVGHRQGVLGPFLGDCLQVVRTQERRRLLCRLVRVRGQAFGHGLLRGHRRREPAVKRSFGRAIGSQKARGQGRPQARIQQGLQGGIELPLGLIGLPAPHGQQPSLVVRVGTSHGTRHGRWRVGDRGRCALPRRGQRRGLAAVCQGDRVSGKTLRGRLLGWLESRGGNTPDSATGAERGGDCK